MKFGSHSSKTAAAFSAMAQPDAPGTVKHCGDCDSHEHNGGSPDCPVTVYIKRDGREKGLKAFREDQKQLTKIEGSVIPLLPCSKCNRPMVIRNNSTNKALFYGCTGFSLGLNSGWCDGTRSMKLGQMIIRETLMNPNSFATTSGSSSGFRR